MAIYPDNTLSTAQVRVAIPSGGRSRSRNHGYADVLAIFSQSKIILKFLVVMFALQRLLPFY